MTEVEVNVRPATKEEQEKLEQILYPWCRKCGTPIFDFVKGRFALLEVTLPNGDKTWQVIRSKNFTPREFRLSNRSKMTLCFCDKCRPVRKDYPALWESVKAFWSKQIKLWSKKKKESYIENYYNLSIVRELK